MRGTGPPLLFYNNSRKTRRIASKFAAPSRWSIWQNFWKFQLNVVSGQQVMTSYVMSYSDEIGRFCDLSQMCELSYFPAYEYVFHVSLLVFMDI